jgi:hypothetical protein
MQKYGTGQILNEENQPVKKTAARPLTQDDVRDIEREDINPQED